MKESSEILLYLLRLASGTDGELYYDLSALSSDVWKEVIALSFRQGVPAIAVDGLNIYVERHPGVRLELDSPVLLREKFEWFGAVLTAEKQYSLYSEVIADLSGLYSEGGVRMMLLKGYGLSLDYPCPNHRQTGDIDVFLSDSQKGDELISRKGFQVNGGYHKHFSFLFRGFVVENHKKFLDDIKHRSNIRLESILESVVASCKYPAQETMIGKGLFLLPNPTFNALFLLRHAGEHFAAKEMTLRQLLDICFFFRSHSANIDWAFVLEKLDSEKMNSFYDVLATIGIKRLGFPASSFVCMQSEDRVSEKVLEDILNPVYEQGLKSFRSRPLRYALIKTRTWWRNRWKFKLVYDESLLSSFWNLAINRLKSLLVPVLLLTLTLTLTLCSQKEEVPVQPTVPSSGVYGTVSCDGVGLEGIAVSDGYAVTTTDCNGCYAIDSDKNNGYVFITVPSGYEVHREGVIPQFFKRLRFGRSQSEKADFELSKCDQSNVSLIMMGDMHLASRMKDDEQFGLFTADVRALMESHPERIYYGFTLGDMSWDTFWYRYNLEDYLATVNKELGNLPVFHTMGNHDNDTALEGDFLAARTYKDIIGPTYYSVNISGFHIIVIDDIICNYSGSDHSYERKVERKQLDWLKQDLALVPYSTPIIVTLHSPVYYEDGAIAIKNGFGGFLSLFEGYKRVQFVSGHTHVVYNVDRLDYSVHVFENNSGAVCGAWWMTGNNYPGLNLCGDGSPSGYRVIDLDKNGSFEWNYKATGKPEDYQFRSYDRNCLTLSADEWCPDATASGKTAFLAAVGDYATPSSDNYVLLNIWDWDPEWKISVTENGRSLTAERLDDVLDPLYLVTYTAFEYQHHYDNSVYYPATSTDHIFRVRASSPTSTLSIKVTDRFGRVYSETMERPKEFVIP